jgi:hypothetical protein
MLMTVFISSYALAQVPTNYEVALRNDTQVSPTIYEFDLYVLNKDLSHVFELDLYQAGIKINPAIVNGGTITASLVAGTSELVALQRPTTIAFVSNCIKLPNPGIVPHGSATIISTVSPGMRIARIRLTNTVSFGAFSPNLTFNFTPSPYNTDMFAYNQTSPFLSVNITNPAYYKTYLSNPILNSGLPIELISFDGQCNNSEVELNWVTASETNNDYFTIQKSSDGISFINVGNINGAGNSNIYEYYSYNDEPYANNITTYYRLKQTDFNGNYTFSKIIYTDCIGDASTLDSYHLYATDEKKIVIQLNTNTVANAFIKVYDLSGKEIAILLNGENIDIGFHTYTCSLNRSGVYIVIAFVNNKEYSNKIII